jgi:hypothetical protein
LNILTTRRGVRTWFAPQDVPGGKTLHEQIDEAIRVHDKLMLVLSIIDARLHAWGDDLRKHQLSRRMLWTNHAVTGKEDRQRP